MIFGHEDHHPTSVAAPQGPTPLWCKLTFISAMLIMVAVLSTPLWR